MVFNPLFLQVVNNQETPLLNKAQKLTGPSYLFSDIIKVQLDKNETGSLTTGKDITADGNLLSSIVSALSSQSAGSLTAMAQNTPGINLQSPVEMKGFNPSLLLGQADKDSSDEKDTTEGGDINSLLVGNSELFNFINELLTNQKFDGKISIVSSEGDGTETSDAAKNSTGTLPVENLSANEVLSLLKNGNTIAVENSAFQSNNGLLITMVELPGKGAAVQADSPVQEGTFPNIINAASAKTLAEMTASQNAVAEDVEVQETEPLYKLKFSLVNNPEVPASAVDTKKPIIKLPFTNGFNVAANTEAADSKTLTTGLMDAAASGLKTTGEDAGLQTGAGTPLNGASTVKDTDTVQAATVIPDGGKTDGAAPPAAVPESQAKNTAGDELMPEPVVNNEDAVKENSASVENSAAKENSAVKDENALKAGKFINIERVKTNSGIQTKETRTTETPRQEMPEQEMIKKDLPAAGSVSPNEGKTQKTNESADKKIEENTPAKSQDAGVINHKEKDLKGTSSQEKQDSSSPAEVKADSKDSAKSEMNSSSKEQNHQAPESTVSGEHAETKGKTQEEHQFSIGTQTKAGEDSFTVKRTNDTSTFAEAAKTVKAAEVMKEISKFIQQGDKNSIVLKIDPENLGTVKIALDLADKVVHANIEVENEAARKLMENNLNQLYNSLSQSGVQLNSINISLANSEHKQGKMPGQKRRNFMDEGSKDTDDIGELRQKQMGYNTLDYLI